MKMISLLSFSLALLVSLLYSTTTLAQLSPAAAPLKPPQPTPTPPAAAPQQPLVPSLPQSPSDSTPDSTPTVDIVGILRKAKSFNILIRLMKTTSKDQCLHLRHSNLIKPPAGHSPLAPSTPAAPNLRHPKRHSVP